MGAPSPGEGSPGSGEPPDSGEPPASSVLPEAPQELAQSAKGGLIWKRYATLEADLARALSLPQDALCTELGERQCIRDLHLVPLGGNQPIGVGIHKPSAQPLSTTPLVIDRVMLSACSARVRADREQAPVVFTELDLKSDAPVSDGPAVDATVSTLFRRLLARDPRASEVTVLKSLLDTPSGEAPLAAADFATLACFVVASSTEFLFF